MNKIKGIDRGQSLRNIMFSLSLTALLVQAPLVGASCTDPGPEDVKKVESSLNKTFPNFDVQKVRKSEVTGLYEVTAGDKIFYYSPDGYVVFGEIWNKDGKSISAEKKDNLMALKLKDLPLEKAVKIGNGKTTVVEISDPDCPYCRKASEFLSKRKDITRYVFLFPLKMHPNAEKKVRYILGAPDRAKAYKQVFTGTMDRQPSLTPEHEKQAAQLLADHQKVVQSLGVQGTPAFWINGSRVDGANIPAMEKLLGKQSS